MTYPKEIKIAKWKRVPHPDLSDTETMVADHVFIEIFGPATLFVVILAGDREPNLMSLERYIDQNLDVDREGRPKKGFEAIDEAVEWRLAYCLF